MSLEVTERYGVVELRGRPSPPLRRFGVPPGGAFDTEALAIANSLVGNAVDETAWELGMAHATFRPACDGVIGIAGAEVSGALECGGVMSIQGGKVVRVPAPRQGARVYVAFRPAKVQNERRLALDELTEGVANRSALRVIAGPQAHLFDLSALSLPFAASQTGNRVGIRLEPGIEAHSVELTSEPQCVGAIQVSNDGTLIAIGPDGPTIGGYPKIAVVASCDIPRLAQLAPGDPVRFEVVTVEEARRLRAKANDRLKRRIQMLRLALDSAP